MRVELPILVQSDTPATPPGSFSVRPLLFEGPVESDKELVRARAKLARRLLKMLGEMARKGRHREVAEYTFCPELRLHVLKFRLDLRRQSFPGRFPVVALRQLSRRVAFCPLLPDTWFEVGRGQGLEVRAREVLVERFRQVERNEDPEEVETQLGPFAPKGKIWLDYLEIQLNTRRKLPAPDRDLFALLAQDEQVDGADEIERVGTCLDHLYPEGLHRCFDPGTQVEELHRLLGGKQRRAVVVVGPPLVGKTTLVHEHVFHRVRARGTTYSRKANVWHLAPGRLISGMMYLGQWENRLLAILKHARKRDHVLFFDDVLGLYHAGVTSQSDLSVADVLKPYVERGDVRVLAEMTPEALRVFRERDRGFADLFHVVTLEEPPAEKLVPLLLKLIRDLELRRGCRFAVDVLPAVLELTRRYQPDLSYPGKAAVLLERLAVKHAGADVDRDHVLGELERQSGLDERFLDRRVRLVRRDVASELGRQIVGQQEAVDAMTDAVTVAKARLNAPDRPLASLLLVGPTGVGKTECAKALARFMFGSEDRLLRFDMNEYLTADAAARLVGTFDRPEGLLTSAVRERPFAVVLLDEIEKAHPNVFDLLLQILGEARLTDALGRTVDFSNAVVILTSNLGTGRAARQLGFTGREQGRRQVYLRAVREFFRPELFNRLDRIIPLDHLGRDELARIAERLLADVLAREGFARRQCALDLSVEGLSWVVEQGYHPELGARAMKRPIEDHVVRPLAVQLAEIPRDVPTVIALGRTAGDLKARVTALDQAEPDPELERPDGFADPRGAITRARRALDRIERECAPFRPEGGLGPGSLAPGDYWYLAVSEGAAALRQRLRGLAESMEATRTDYDAPALVPRQPKDRTRRVGRAWSGPAGRRILKEMVAARDVHDYLAELQRSPPSGVPADRLTAELLEVYDSVAVLHAFRPGPGGWATERALVIVRGLSRSDAERECLVQEVLPNQGFSVRFRSDGANPRREEPEWYALEGTPLRPGKSRHGGHAGQAAQTGDGHMDVLAFDGPHAFDLLARNQGTYLFTDAEGRLHPVQVVVVGVEAGRDPDAVLRDCLAANQKAVRAEGDRPGDAPDDDPLAWRPVVAVYAWQRSGPRAGRYGRVIDFRAGLHAAAGGVLAYGDVFQASLPLPPELRE